MLWEKKPQPTPPGQPPTSLPLPNPVLETPMKDATVKQAESTTVSPSQTLLGPSVVLKGELAGDEDMRIEGQFDGCIKLPDHCLTVGQRGQVKANILATRVIISGSVTRNISARERIEIRKTGSVMGDLVAPGIAIEDGAYFKGSIEILREEERRATPAFSASTVQETSA